MATQCKAEWLLELGGGTELEQGDFWFSLQESFPCSNSGGKTSYFFPMLHLTGGLSKLGDGCAVMKFWQKKGNQIILMN